ncbi:hypothetical protein Csa_015712 [Cucumis sativus]|uniref:Uncharacterized protein n=1 Tax=Cucumis sativus TaxID=3659 RepID=A0A0A0K507_CUCSA|nr:hypothetical protein Csa_015712 [Cucumis sativus]
MTNPMPECTLRDLAAPDFTQQPFALPIPRRHVVLSDDPHKFTKEFHVVYSNMGPHRVTKEERNLSTFLLALKDDAKD